jgi:hypothetical protein
VAPLATNTEPVATNTVLTVDTFDGLTYVANIGASKEDNYPVIFTISAKPSAPADKLTRTNAYAGWVYYLPSYTVDEILKPRNQLLVPETNAVSTASSK